MYVFVVLSAGILMNKYFYFISLFTFLLFFFLVNKVILQTFSYFVIIKTSCLSYEYTQNNMPQKPIFISKTYMYY